jgi:hypothetical protein
MLAFDPQVLDGFSGCYRTAAPLKGQRPTTTRSALMFTMTNDASVVSNMLTSQWRKVKLARR